MRGFYLLAAVALLAAVPASAETLTNSTVVQLSSAGLGDAAIIAKIQNSDTSFDLSTQQMVQLKQQGVTGPVIAAMLDASNKTAAPASYVDDVARSNGAASCWGLPARHGRYRTADGPDRSDDDQPSENGWHPRLCADGRDRLDERQGRDRQRHGAGEGRERIARILLLLRRIEPCDRRRIDQLGRRHCGDGDIAKRVHPVQVDGEEGTARGPRRKLEHREGPKPV